MRQAKNDRRSLRTRQLLMQAMVDLIRDKRYDAITVQEIADRADVGRSTFYAHFTDKDDLLADGVQRMLAILDTTVPTRRDALYPTLALLHHLGAQADLYRVMARGRALSIFLAALQDELNAVFAQRLAARVPPGQRPAVPPPLLAAMITSILVTAIRSWLEDGAALPAEEVDRMFHAVAGPAARAGLRPGPPEGDRPTVPIDVWSEHT